jgi:hypothetical protein
VRGKAVGHRFLILTAGEVDRLGRPPGKGRAISFGVCKKKRVSDLRTGATGQEGARRRSAGKREDRSGEGLKKRTRKKKLRTFWDNASTAILLGAPSDLVGLSVADGETSCEVGERRTNRQ